MSLQDFVEHARAIEPASKEGEALRAAIHDRAALLAYAGAHGIALSADEQDVILALPAAGEALSDEALDPVSGGTEGHVSDKFLRKDQYRGLNEDQMIALHNLEWTYKTC